MYYLICIAELLLLCAHIVKDTCFDMPVLMQLMQVEGIYYGNTRNGRRPQMFFTLVFE